MRVTRTRAILLALLVVCSLVVAIRLWPSGESRSVDPTLVETAAENSRATKAKSPPPPDQPTPQGSFNAPMTRKGGS
jgi:regulatory protein YycH of two-component signal transduction system YycFG